MQRTRWTERTFSFDFPEGWLSNILERLYGTIVRLQALVADLTEEQLSMQPAGKWSIKENIGHLSDLEGLHEGRIDDFIAGKPVLRAADMQNAKTKEANHNNRAVEDLLNDFTARRMQFILRLSQLDDSLQVSKAMHPRLQVMMRPVDVAYFTAEHDDHHLADIRAILQRF